MSEPINHHFLPTFYLRGFTDPASEGVERLEPFSWHYSVFEQQWRRRGYSTKKAVSGQNLYSTKDANGRPTAVLEKEVMSPFDRLAATIIRDKLSNGLALTPTEEEQFAFFLALMHLRVPHQIRAMESLVNRMGQDELRKDIERLRDDPVRFAESMERYRQETGKDLREMGITAEMLVERMPKMKANRNGVLASALAPAEMIASMLLQRRWLFFVADGAAFVTSDVPCVIFDRTKPANLYPGLASPDVELTFAVTSRLMISIFEDEGSLSRKYIAAKRDVIGALNARTIAHADQLVVAPRMACLGCTALPVHTIDPPEAR